MRKRDFNTLPHLKEEMIFMSTIRRNKELYYSLRRHTKKQEVGPVLWEAKLVLEDFQSVQMPFEWLVQLVPPLKTRAFSIASSCSAHPNQVHLTVSGVLILAWFQKGSLPSPPPSLPLILVGPGTGCAPFRGFAEESALQSQSGPTAPNLFFFGCRNEENDFLYRDFWLFRSRKDGVVLSEEKGGGFLEESFKIWNLLTEGPAVYVAGSANKMPCDVLSAFEEIVSKEGGVPKEAAVRCLRTLEKAGKYHVEAWS
ncbi:unnamed protein product [Withania somnifera]